MKRSTSSHFALRQGNRRGEWATACGRSVRERTLSTVEFAEWISCSECRKAALAARQEMAVPPAPPDACTARHPGIGAMCGLNAGHTGRHEIIVQERVTW